MTPEEALYKTRKKFTNLVGGDILPGVSVGEIISYYESQIAKSTKLSFGTDAAITDKDCNITKSFREEEIKDDEFYLRNGYSRY